MRASIHSGLIVITLSCGWVTGAVAQAPQPAEIAKAAGAYLSTYAERLGTVAAEEEYTQREPAAGGSASRRLQSDIVIMGLDEAAVVAFRDVYAIDSRAVRERDDRLGKLLASPTESSQAQAKAWADEGVRHYLSPNLRTLDMPTLALEFLRPVHLEHSDFTLDGIRRQDGAQVATLKFRMRDGASVLPTPDGSKTNGRIWVEVGTGVIRQTELIVEGKGFSFRVTTKYAQDPGLGLWVPSEVSQMVDLSSGAGGMSNMGAGGNMGARQSLESRAKYSKFRRLTP